MILLKLARGSKVYSLTFFREINCDGYFHVSEDCQYHLYSRVSLFPLHGLSFQLGLKSFINAFFFLLEHSSLYISHYSLNFTWYTFLSHKIWWQTSIQAWNMDLLSFWIAAKILRDENFCYKPTPNNE